MSTRDHAIDLMKRSSFQKAIPLFRDLISENPNDASLYYMAGQSYRFIGDLNSACSYLSRAHELDPDSKETLLALGIAFQLMDKYSDAISVFKKAVMIDPDYVLAYNSLGVTYRKNGCCKEALSAYEEGLRALSRNILKTMVNNETNPVHETDISLNTLWMEWSAFAMTYLCCLNNINRMEFPSGDMALEEEKTESHMGLFWEDRTNDKGEKIRFFLPNFFNAFKKELRKTNSYANLIGNTGTVLEMLGKNKEAERHFDEAREFAS